MAATPAMAGKPETISAAIFFGALADLPGKLKSRWDRQLAKLRLFGLFDGDINRDAVPCLDVVAKGLLNAFFERMEQTRV
jgi:hypothetical protein